MRLLCYNIQYTKFQGGYGLKNKFSEKTLKIIKWIAIGIGCAAVTLLSVMMVINSVVILSTQNKIYDTPKDITVNDYDCILVLGAGIRQGRPSDMLADRLNVAIELYKNGVAKKILVSGDHGQVDYDEVNVMKNYCIENGVPSEDVFMDHAGFSTYESIYRAKEIFGVSKMVICTQEYHLYRALYIAEAFDIEAVGVNCTLRNYVNQFMRECREIVARCKDTFTSLFKPQPTYLGDKITLNGSGDVTNDQIAQ